MRIADTDMRCLAAWRGRKCFKTQFEAVADADKDGHLSFVLPKNFTVCVWTNGKVGHPQACVYPDACLWAEIVSGKAPLLGQGIRWIPLPLPLRAQEPLGGVFSLRGLPERSKGSVGFRSSEVFLGNGPVLVNRGNCEMNNHVVKEGAPPVSM